MLGIGQSAAKSNKQFLVYKLTNTINGKAYIGITARSEPERWSEHKVRAKQGVRNSRLYDAIRKYGPDAFNREVIATASTEDELRELEKRYIQEFNTYDAGYNSNIGGHGFLEFPEHIRIKIGKAQKGKIISPESRKKMSAAKLGDSRCAIHFGEHTQKGGLNPRSKSFRIQLPDGSEQVVRGLRAFCREKEIYLSHMYIRGKSKGFVLLERLND